MKKNSRQKLCLIAENDTYIAGILKFHLQKKGYRTLIVEDGLIAVETLYETQPDLIILDSMLPELEGYELCAQAKDASKTCHILVLMPRPGGGDEPGDFILGADDYLMKPFDVRDFLARVVSLEQQAAFERDLVFRRRNSNRVDYHLVCDEE